MKNLIRSVLCITILNSCSSMYDIRESVEGYIYNNETMLPIDSVSIEFIEGLEYGNIPNENSYPSNVSGYFKIPKYTIKTNYQLARRKRKSYSKYLKLSKKGFFNDTIYVGSYNDSKYTYDLEKYSIIIDTIYLEPMKN